MRARNEWTTRIDPGDGVIAPQLDLTDGWDKRSHEIGASSRIALPRLLLLC
jgi:hypothetical protein